LFHNIIAAATESATAQAAATAATAGELAV